MTSPATSDAASPAAHASPIGLFARTKICPPRQRPGQVHRHAVVNRLQAAMGHHRLALLTAPAGFGKTAVLTQFLQQLPASHAWCWISAEAEDDPGRLVDCLTTALDPYDLPWRMDPQALVEQAQQGRKGLRQTAAEVANTLASSEHPCGVIVMDDAHRILDPAVFEWLDAFLEALPPGWTTLISSRTEPALALPRWRARGELMELRQSHLQFSNQEIDDWLTALGQGQSPERLLSLAQRTHGWAAGLSLLLRTDQPGQANETRPEARHEQNRHMFDFLASEVLAGLPQDLQTFLLRCSVLSELTAPRCAAVSGLANAASLLDETERLGLFVSVLDHSELTLQLHDLFKDFLQDRLRKTAAQELPLLLEKAAQSEADPVRRLGFLIKAQAWSKAEEALCGQADDMIARGDAPQVLRLVQQFPEAWRTPSARLTHLHGRCAWAQWDLVTMIDALARAADLHDQAGQLDAAQEARMLQVLGLSAGGQVLQSYALLEQVRQRPLSPTAEIMACQASSWHAVAASAYDQAAKPFGAMVSLLQDSRNPALWLQCVPLTSFLGLPGTSAPLQGYVEGAQRLQRGEDPSPLSVMAGIFRAGLDLWAGDIDGAARGLQTCLEDCRWLNQPPNLMGYWSLVAGLTHAVRGDREAALNAAAMRLASLDDERTSGRKATWLNHFYFYKVRVACILGDRQALMAACALLEANPKPDEHRLFVNERATLPGRLAEIDEHWPEAAAHYQQALKLGIAIDLYGQGLEIQVRLAHALLMSGQSTEAAHALARAVDQAHQRGDMGGALFAGSRVLHGLAAHAWRDALDPSQCATVQAWARTLPAPPGGLPSFNSAPQAGTQPLPTPAHRPPIGLGSLAQELTSREQEVLQLMSQGDSNKLIARTLDLSPHTVKRHVANILDKLGVSSRGQAVAWLNQRA